MNIPEAAVIPMAALLACLAIFFLGMAIRAWLERPERYIARRLERIGADPDPEEGDPRERPEPGERDEGDDYTADRTPMEQTLYDNLLLVGYRGEDPLRTFQTQRLLFTAFCALVLFVVFVKLAPTSMLLFLTVLGAGFGYLSPKLFWLPAKIRFCRQEIIRGFPDTLDLIVVCVEAGLSLDASLLKVAEERSQHGDPLGIVFQQLHNELLAGKPRAEALRDMADRINVDEIQAMVAMLIQSERLGTGIGHTLRIHSDLLRTKRFIQAEEHSAKAPIKLLIPLVLFIFPSIFIIVLGPVLLQLFGALGTMLGR